ncbi:MAG: putative CRISPR-associated protein [Actinobacteria bacterium]|nr:putative CRISPR-associated protein [Actinomycetota bacterium]
MKTVVTTVGISLYENYLEGKRDIREHYEVLRDEPGSAYDTKAERINKLKWPLKEFLVSKPQEASAETKSVLKLRDRLRDDLVIRLISTDTVLSMVAADLLAETGCGIGVESRYNREQDTIKGLQVADAGLYREEGSKNLLRRLYRLHDECGGNMVINMTGGFKATIPLLTIFGQLNDIRLYYIFENTDALIEIPQAPMDIAWAVFDAHAGLLSELEKNGVIECPGGDPVKKHPELDALVEFSDGLLSMSALGTIMWRRYRTRREIVYFSEHAKREWDRLDVGDRRALARTLSGLRAKLLARSSESDLRHSLKGLDLPDGFHCYKTRTEGQEARIVWSRDEWETDYGASEMDLHIASFYTGSEVHNADSEYVDRLRALLRSDAGKIFNKTLYKPVTIEKGERSTSMEVEYV